MSGLRPIAGPFVAATPAGARVRTRLHVGCDDGDVLRAIGTHLGSLAGRDLAARCRQGHLAAKDRAACRAVRKQALTAASSSRWAGAITRTSEDAYQLAMRNLAAEQRSLQARIGRIQIRLAAPVGGRDGRRRGYVTAAERHAKTIRLDVLHTRLAQVQPRLDAGVPAVCRGGKALLRNRNNLATAGRNGAGLTVEQWRAQWRAARLLVTADEERDKTWGNKTIRFNPDQGWLEIKLPTPLAHRANRPHGRYRLSCPVAFSYRGDEVAAQAATGAVRYDISFDPGRGRWYLDASGKTVAGKPPTLDWLRSTPVVAVDVNVGHLEVAVLDPHGNPIGTPDTIPLELAGVASTTRDGRLRDAISRILSIARDHGAGAVVIENLDFAAARTQGREHTGHRPARGRRGRAFRRQVAGIPTARLRDRLSQMAHNAGLAVVAVDPAYTSRWGAQHWLDQLQRHHPKTTGHHAAALMIGRRGLGLSARTRRTPNTPAPAEAGGSTAPGHRAIPQTHDTPRKPPARTDSRQPVGTKTGQPRKTTAGNQATQHRSRPPPTRTHS